jgi:hypothetical protein
MIPFEDQFVPTARTSSLRSATNRATRHCTAGNPVIWAISRGQSVLLNYFADVGSFRHPTHDHPHSHRGGFLSGSKSILILSLGGCSVADVSESRATGRELYVAFSIRSPQFPIIKRLANHERSFLARTLGLWVRITLEAWMSLFILCFCCLMLR